MTLPTRIRVRIDRLVVDGAPDVRADVLAAAIVEQLTQLATTATPPTHVPDELVVDLVREPEPGGRAIAAALHARLTAEVVHA